LGHTLNARQFYTGQANTIIITAEGAVETGADPRGENHAAGY